MNQPTKEEMAEIDKYVSEAKEFRDPMGPEAAEVFRRLVESGVIPPYQKPVEKKTLPCPNCGHVGKWPS